MPDDRKLSDLAGVGKVTLASLQQMGVRSVAQLARQNPQRLYDRLCRIQNQRVDPCALDVMHCAVAQARNPRLPAEQCNWWYWSAIRKDAEQAARLAKAARLPKRTATAKPGRAARVRRPA